MYPTTISTQPKRDNIVEMLIALGPKVATSDNLWLCMRVNVLRKGVDVRRLVQGVRYFHNTGCLALRCDGNGHI